MYNVQDEGIKGAVASPLLSQLILSGKSKLLHHEIIQVVLCKGLCVEEIAVPSKRPKEWQSSSNRHVNEPPRKQHLKSQSNKPSDDCSHNPHLEGNLMRDLETNHPVRLLLNF